MESTIRESQACARAAADQISRGLASLYDNQNRASLLTKESCCECDSKPRGCDNFSRAAIGPASRRRTQPRSWHRGRKQRVFSFIKLLLYVLILSLSH